MNDIFKFEIIKKFPIQQNMDIFNTIRRIYAYNNQYIDDSLIWNDLILDKDFPSLYSISEALNKWKTKHCIIKIKDENLSKTDFPFLTFITEENVGKFIYITQVDEKYIYFYYSNNNRKKEKIDTFKHKWNNTILIIEEFSNIGRINKQNRHAKIFKFSLYIIPILTLSYLIISKTFNLKEKDLITFILFILCNITGFIICYKLFLQDLKNKDYIFQKYCKIGNLFDCKAVLQSPIAKPFGIISLSEIGIVYFICNILCFIFYANTTLLFLYPISIGGCAISVILLLYQKIIIKKWCLFCILIQALIFINTILLSKNSIQNSLFFDFNNLFKIVSIYIAVICLLFLFKLTIEFCYKYIESEIKHTLIKRDYNIFEYLLKNEPISKINNNAGIILGNKESNICITFILSMTCKYCIDTVKYLKLLHNNYPQIKYQLLLKIPTDNKSKEKTKLIIGKYLNNDEKDLINIIEKNLQGENINESKYNKKYIETKNNSCKIENIILSMQDQLEKINNLQTPEILWNNYILHPMYNIKDLSYIIESKIKNL